MESEVALPRVGELRLADLKAVYGASLRSMCHIDVLVLDAGGGVPVTARVELGELRAGRGNHCALVCPSCGAGKSLLLARHGALKCRGCHGHLTRRALEHRSHDWTRLGGGEEDAILRVFQPARHLTPGRLDQARDLAAALVAADQLRVTELQERLATLSANVGSDR